MRNYNSETSLQGLFPEKDVYKWTGQTTFDTQKSRSEEIVTGDLLQKNFELRNLQLPLYLVESTAFTETTEGSEVEETITRNRLVINVTAFTTGTKSVTLQGRANSDDAWHTITTVSITATGEQTAFFSNAFKEYRLNTTISAGAMTYEAYLVETIYDNLFLFKWAELIMFNSIKESGDQFEVKMVYLREEYNRMLDNARIWYDSNENREIEATEGYNTQITGILR